MEGFKLFTFIYAGKVDFSSIFICGIIRLDRFDRLGCLDAIRQSRLFAVE